MKKLAVLGCGNMAQAIVKGMFANQLDFTYFTYTPSKIRAEQLANDVHGKVVEALNQLPSCDFYLIACKPQQFELLSRELKTVINTSATIISILAGTPVSTIQKQLGTSSVIRVMPNTPCLVGKGVSTFFATDEVSHLDRQLIRDLFNRISEVFVFENELLIDKTTAISGSGPAYFFEWMRIFEGQGEKYGLTQKQSRTMALKTFQGALELLEKSEESAEQLRKNVTSKGGVTAEALAVFEKADLNAIVDRALSAAYKRVEELKN